MAAETEGSNSLIYEKDYFRQLITVHQTSLLFYRRSDEIKEILNKCIPELHSVRSAGEIRQVARLLAKSSSPQQSGLMCHPKFSMIVAEVDHTIIKFMEVIHKYYEIEQKMSSRLPLLLLMSPNVDQDLKMYVKTCEDVHCVLETPSTPKAVFEAIAVMLHRRRVADDLFTRLTSSRPSKHISEAKCSSAGGGGQLESVSTVQLVHETSSSLAEEIDEEDLAQDEMLSHQGLTIFQYLQSSRELLARDACSQREYYMKQLKQRNMDTTIAKYTIDSTERARIDEVIEKNLHKGINYSLSFSGKAYQTLSLEGGDESKQEELARVHARTSAAAMDPIFRADSCNIMDDTFRPLYNVNDSSQTNLFGSDLLPFVDRPRPDMSRPRTVAGHYQKNAAACWRVMQSKAKLSKHVEHKHERPWATPHMQARKKTLAKPATDSEGTMTLETFMKIRDQITKHDSASMKNIIMEEAIPIPTGWACPKSNKPKTSQQKKDEFKRELNKTKKVLRNLHDNKIPPIEPSSRPDTAPASTSKLLRTPRESIEEEAEDEDGGGGGGGDGGAVPVSEHALGAVRGWRGISENSLDDSASLSSAEAPGKSSKPARRLSAMLHSVGGINFGSMVVNAKARDKAKRMVHVMATTAPQDMQTSRMIWVNLENRRVSSVDRENLAIGIVFLSNDELEKAFKCFSKCIMVCKHVHIAMIYRGIVQYRRGKFFQALADFTDASKTIESSNVLIKNHIEDVLIARFNRGMTHFRLGNDAPGILDIKFALAINPANVHVRSILMQVQRRSCNYIEAVEHCMVIKNIAEEEAAVIADAKKKAQQSLGGESSDDFNMKLTFPATKSPTSSKTNTKSLKRGTSHFDSMIDYAMSSELLKPKNVGVDVKEPESCFPSLRERKEDFLLQKNQECSTQNSMYLENFKHENGYKRHMFDTHFIRLTDIQEALIQTQYLRSEANKALIMRCLRSFAIFSDVEEELLLRLAGCVEYRAVHSKSVLFFQDDPVDAVLLVLTGQLQLRLDSRGGAASSAVVAELNQFDTFGPFGCLFHKGNTAFLQKMYQICEDAENGKRTDFSPQQLDAAASFSSSIASSQCFSEQDLPRALQPGGFMTCKVAKPTELIMVHKADFDRLLRGPTEIQFFKRLELLKASGVFSGDFSYYDLVRLGRMSVLRRYRQGEVILSQGEVPEFMYFVLKGICKAMKRPDPTEYLAQRLVLLKTKVDNFDELYTYHHSLRTRANPSSSSSTPGSPPEDVEEEHRNLKLEIASLEVQHAKEIVLEKKRRQEEQELIHLGHNVPERFVEVSSLHWPQVFGEAAILQPDGGVSAGTVVADTNCHLMCLHKSHLQASPSVISSRVLGNVRDRMVVYPSHEQLVVQLADKEGWASYKAEALEKISKERWPGCQAAKPVSFYT